MRFVRDHILALLLAVVFAGPLVVFDGPGGVEYAIAPVAKNVESIVTKATAREVCITTRFKRARSADAVSVSWAAQDVTGKRSFISVYRVNMDTAILTARANDVGADIVYINCHIRPPAFQGRAYMVQARVDYEVRWQHLWDVRRRDDPVLVPPVK